MSIGKFIENTNKSNTVKDLFDYYKKEMYSIGFDRVIFSLMTDHVAIERKAGHGVIANYPDDWMGYYKENRFEVIDPVRCSIYSSSSVFSWESLIKQGRLTKNQTKLMNMAEDATLYNGIGIPFRSTRGAIAGIGAAASTKSHNSPDKNVLSFANLVSQQFYTAFIELEKKNLGENRQERKPVRLSDREQEVLQWSSRGKTKWEISCILSISEHTVTYHAKNAMKKLDSNNMSLAILKALNLGIIQL